MSDLVLEVIEGPLAGRQLPLTSPFEAGRSSQAGLTLDDTQVSRHHARFEPSADGAVVSDLGSTNGTYVNEQPIYTARVWPRGDRVSRALSVLWRSTAGRFKAQPSSPRP